MDQEFSDSVKRAVEGSAEQIKEKISEFTKGEEFERVRESAAELAEEAAAFVRKHPLPSVFGGLAAGFLLGLLFEGRRSRR
jgi:ElaB/YqjD/DUF883 family membrane-anchored ribosome-binding protein